MRRKIAHFFLRNAQKMAGIPVEDLPEEPVKVELEHRHQHASAPNPAPPTAGAFRRLWPLLLTGALAGGAGSAATWMLQPGEAERSGSLLQYLEDEGFHVPEVQ